MKGYISKKYLLLHLIHDNTLINEYIHSGELFKKSGLTHAYYFKCVQEFLKQGLIVRKRSETEKRVYLITMTEQGRKFVNQPLKYI